MENENKSSIFMGSGISQWRDGDCQTVQIVITQNCNLRCKYCYMVDKNSHNDMSFETGKKLIDYLLESGDIFTRPAVVLEFIGGEPLIKIDLIDEIVDYFKVQSYIKKHPWWEQYRVSMATNGLLYDDPKVQKFLMKNEGKVSMGISIDGTKEKHDLQRIYPDGRGSYNDVVKNIDLWLEQFGNPYTKVTIGHDDLKYTKESILHLWSLGIKDIPANVIFEDVWEEGDDEIFYNQLKDLADCIISEELWKDNNTTLFDTSIGNPLSKAALGTNYCGTGKMIAVDSKGIIYPCVRFMSYSLDHYPSLPIGDIENGLSLDKVRPFNYLDVPSQSDDECINCEVASGCAWCTGYNYDSSEDGSIFKRSKSICKMHKARVRANDYFWRKLEIDKGIPNPCKKNNRKTLFVMLSDSSAPYCHYSPNDKEEISLSDDMLTKVADFCDKNFFQAVLLHSKNAELSEKAKEIFKYKNFSNLYYANSLTQDVDQEDVTSVRAEEILAGKELRNSMSSVLTLKNSQVDYLSFCTIKMLKNTRRIVVNLQPDVELDLGIYQTQLEKIGKEVFGYLMNDDSRDVDIITDSLFYNERISCEAGVRSLTLAPNGLLYICPAFYYQNPENSIGSLEGEFHGDIEKYCSEDSSSFCKECKLTQCKRCVFQNKSMTNEYMIPSINSCKKAAVERTVSCELYSMLKQAGYNHPMVNLDGKLNETLHFKERDSENLDIIYDK